MLAYMLTKKMFILLCFSCGLLILCDPDMLLSLHALNGRYLTAQVSSGHSESHCSLFIPQSDRPNFKWLDLWGFECTLLPFDQ